MEHGQVDLATINMINTIENYKSSSQRQQLEAFKIDQIVNLMDNCSNKCGLQYKESGIKDQTQEDVQCFTTCLTKSHNISRMLHQ